MDTIQKISDLEQLARQAEQIESTVPPAGDTTQPPEPEKATNAQIIGAAIAAGRTVFCAVSKLDSPKIHLNDEQSQKLGAVWGPVLDKHGINLNKAMGDYALEIGAAVVTFEIVMALRTAVREEIAAKDAKHMGPVETVDSAS